MWASLIGGILGFCLGIFIYKPTKTKKRSVPEIKQDKKSGEFNIKVGDYFVYYDTVIDTQDERIANKEKHLLQLVSVEKSNANKDMYVYRCQNKDGMTFAFLGDYSHRINSGGF